MAEVIPRSERVGTCNVEFLLSGFNLVVVFRLFSNRVLGEFNYAYIFEWNPFDLSYLLVDSISLLLLACMKKLLVVIAWSGSFFSVLIIIPIFLDLIVFFMRLVMSTWLYLTGLYLVVRAFELFIIDFFLALLVRFSWPKPPAVVDSKVPMLLSSMTLPRN